MIAPDVEVLGVGLEGYAWLCDLVAARQSLQGDWLWGRHDGRRLLGSAPVLPDGDDRLMNVDLAEPVAAASHLRMLLGVERVVLVDERHREALAQSLDEAATGVRTQWEFFRACQRAFWQSPAIATFPAAPADSWGVVARALRDAADLDVVLLVLDQDDLLLGLRAVIRGGLMVRLTGALSEGEELPPDLDSLVACVDAAGRPEVVVACTRDALHDALRASDAVAGLARMAASSDILYARGLDWLGALFTVGAAP